MIEKENLIKISDYIWEIPKSFRADMRVPARFWADKKLLEDALRDKSFEQLVNVATLPGLVNYAVAMPDMHEGYGFPIGGVAGIDAKNGVISPGGVGYDINCGVRVLRSDLNIDDVQPRLVDLMNQLQRDAPSGVGRGGPIKLGEKEMKNVLEKGVRDLAENGYADYEDIANCEEQGQMAGADAFFVSDKAKERGRDQLGTLGSGNHFLEAQKVDKIFDEEIAKTFGLSEDQITIMIHCGSRGLGHQVATDYVSLMDKVLPKYRIFLPDRELACAPFSSPEGQQYFSAMATAANFAWANRQMITHFVRGAWKRVLGERGGELRLIYDVAHNIAKIERHSVVKEENLPQPLFYKEGSPSLLQRDGRDLDLIVHRKGATRAFPPQSKEIPEKYRAWGQPVLIPGTMGTASYVLAGVESGRETFYSVCHGAGRVMSRHAALAKVSGNDLKRRLELQGIIVRALSLRGLAEEAPLAYKDIDNVVDVVVKAGLAKRVARLKPIGVIKG